VALAEYEPGTGFPGTIGRTVEESSPAWPSPIRAREGAPNVLFFVLDDVGYGQLGCFGGLVETPNIDRVAAFERLAQLRDQGILSEEEFEAKKKQILGI
jgi:hypothetical protein